MDLNNLTISEAHELLTSRQVSSRELTLAALERITDLDGGLHAFLRVTPDLAMLEAQRADARLARGEAKVLTGIPMAVKDIMSTRGIETTCGSRILENYVPQYSATVVERLSGAGAVLLGKTNLDEFAMGSSNENSSFGPTRNAWDETRVPGGSSGGSASAVASGEAVFALGTETGGSVRQPAALSGIVGVKPTYGRVSRYGVIAFASSLDQVGPLARTTEDAALVLQTIAGPDPRDSTTLSDPVPDYRQHLKKDLRGVRLGVPREYFGEGMHDDVRVVLEDALRTLRELGAELIEVSLPSTPYALSAYYVIAPAEAMANLARYDGVRQGLSVEGEDVWEVFSRTREAGFGAEVKRRILLGTFALAAGYYDAYYLRAQKVRDLIRQEFTRVFAEVDALVTPTSPTVAFRLGEKVDDPLQMYLSDVYTCPANIAGICGISIPAGFADDLPVGLQILGPHLGEERIFQVAHAFEQATPHHLRRAAIAHGAACGG